MKIQELIAETKDVKFDNREFTVVDPMSSMTEKGKILSAWAISQLMGGNIKQQLKTLAVGDVQCIEQNATAYVMKIKRTK